MCTTTYQAGGIYPPNYSKQKKYSFIRWIPALFYPAMQTIYQKFVSICPPELVIYNTHYLRPEEQIKSAISLLLTAYVVDNIPGSLANHKNSDIGQLFFSGQAMQFTDFKTKQLPETINLWLSRLYLAKKTINFI